MKKLTTQCTRALLLIAIVMSYTVTNAQTFTLSVQNQVQTAPNKLEFDVYLLNTNPAQPFELATLQLGFLLNSNIYTGGTLSATINNAGSGLNASQQFVQSPNNVVGSLSGYPNQTLVRQAGRTPPGAGNGTIISTVSPGTLVTHYSLQSTVNFAAGTTPDIIFTSSSATPPLYATSISHYVGGVNTLLTVTPGSNAIVNGNPMLNPALPAAYAMTGGGSYCQGDAGLPVGLSNSEIGVTYTLYKDAIAQVPTYAGTGAALSFGTLPAGTYTVNGTNFTGTTPMTGSAVITEITTAVVSISISPSANPVCDGTPVTYTATPVNEGTAPLYQWKVNGGNAGTNSPTFDYTPVNGDVINCVLTSNAPCNSGGPATSNDITMTVRGPLTASVVTADQNICYGTAPVSLNASNATGGSGPYIYQWQSSPDGLAGWTDIPGENAQTFNPGNLVTTSYYRVTVTDAGTPVCGTLTSNMVTITVADPLNHAQIGNDQTICYNDIPLELTATPATGGIGPFTYQWQKRETTSWINVGTNSLAYQPPALTVTTDYRLVATDSGIPSCGSAVSNIITVTVQSIPLAGAIGADQVLCQGAPPAPLTSITDGTGSGVISYEWESSTNGGASWANIPGETGAGYTPGTPAQATSFHRITVSTLNTVICKSTPTSAVTISPNNLSANTIGSAQSLCSGNTASLTGSLVTGDGAITYQWQSGNSEFGTYTNVATGGTGQDYVTDVLSADTWFRRVAVSTLNGVDCSTNSNAVLISVSPVLPVSVTINPDANPSCEGATVLLTATPVNGGTPTIQWYKNSLAVGTNSLTYSFVPVTGDQVYCVLTSSEVCSSGNPATSNTVAMLVNPILPVSVSISPSSNPACSGTPVTFTATPVNGGTTPTYQWKLNNMVLPGETGATFVSSTLVNLDQVSVVLTSSETCKSGSPATSNTITMTIDPAIIASVITANQAICYGTAAVPLHGNQALGGSGNFNYQWQNSPDGITWTNIAGATNRNLNPGILFATTYYRLNATDVVPSSCGEASSNVVTITVNNLITAPVAGTSQVICYNTVPAALSASGATGGSGSFGYQWETSPDGLTAWTALTGETSLTFAPGAMLATGYFRVTATDLAFPLCLSSSNVINITVQNPLTAPVIGNGQTICYNDIPAALSATAATGGTGPFNYQWQSNDAGSWNNVGTNSLTYQPPSLTLTTDYRLIATDAGTPSCGALPSNVITITVQSVPLAGSIGTDQTLCQGTAAAPLISVTDGSGSGLISYEWESSTDGGLNWVNIPGETGAGFSPGIPAQATIYHRITVSTLNTSVCKSLPSASVTISMNSLTANTIGTAQSVCSGTTASLTGNVVTGSGTVSYQWQNSSTEMGTYTNVPSGGTGQDYVTDALTADTWFRRVATSSLNGVDCFANSNSILVTVNSNLPVSVSVAPDANPSCNGTTVVFTATPTNGGIPSYQWYLNSQAVGTDSPTYSLVPVTGDQVNVVMTSSLTCQTGSPATSNTVTMAVTDNLPVSVLINVDANPVCSGNLATFTASPVNGGTPSYQWYVNNTAVGTNNPVYSYSPANGDQVYVVMTSSILCTTGSPANSNIITMQVNSLLPASVSIVADANPVCAGTTVSFTATPVNGGTTPVYQWYNGNTPVGTNSPSYSYVPVNGDIISVAMTPSVTCISGNPVSNAITMSVNPILATADFSADNLNPPAATTVLFTDLSTGTATSWNWSFNPATVTFVNGTTVASQNPQVQFAAGGAYSVTLTVNETGCPNSITKADYIYVGTPGLWTGLTSTDWNNPSNWDNSAIPVTLTDVVIPASAPFWPTFTGSITVGTTCKSITLAGPASQLTVTGNLTILNGYTVNNQGSVIIQGL